MSHLAPGTSKDKMLRNAGTKRKRPSYEEDVENVKPSKKLTVSRSSDADVYGYENSSPVLSSSEADPLDLGSLLRADCEEDLSSPEGNFDDNLYSPPYNVLSPLENVLDHDSPSLKRKFSKNNSILNVACKRKCPLPKLSWADSCDVWKKMCEGDALSSTLRNPNLIKYHPGLTIRMRAILLDWLNEVCEVYKMHRETFHLTVNYVDRYLSSTQNVPKSKLQLIGITCLFIASKVEEVYPPKIGEFAYVTDGACTTEDILSEEIDILSILKWQTTPTTINRWLNAYMQLISIHSESSQVSAASAMSNEIKQYTFIFPQYSSLEYVICGQLVDLAALHVGVNSFPYSMVAAAAVAHIFDKDTAVRVSSYSHEEILPCYEWLTAFSEVLAEEGGVGAGQGEIIRMLPDCGAEFIAASGGLNKICPNINLDQSHRIQVHNICLDMFDKAEETLTSRNATLVNSTPTSSKVINSGESNSEKPSTSRTKQSGVTSQ